MSPIVAQSPDEIPLFTVSQNSENSLFNGVGKIGKFQPPPGVFLFLRPCCPGQVLSCPGPGIVGKTSTRGPWGRFSALAFPKLGAWSWERLAKRFKAPSPLSRGYVTRKPVKCHPQTRKIRGRDTSRNGAKRTANRYGGSHWLRQPQRLRRTPNREQTPQFFPVGNTEPVKKNNKMLWALA